MKIKPHNTCAQSQLFRSKIIFLQNIPDNIYFSLSQIEWYLPDQLVNMLRLSLEKRLDQYVMPYKREIFDLTLKPEQHLCAVLKGASLNKQQLVTLTEFESFAKVLGVSFVIYKKPIEIINVTKSELYRYYQQNRLL